MGLLLTSSLVYAADLTVFDDEILKARGIDVSIAQKLAAAPSFLPGEQVLKVYVNNEYKNDISINIDQQGNPCLTKNNLNDIGLILPLKIKESSECLSLISLWPASDIVKKPADQALWLFVPEKAVDPQKKNNDNYTYGGYGGIVNYSAQYMGGSDSSSNDMYFVNSEIGINADNWIFRSLQIFNRSTKSEFHHQYAYGQTTLESLQKNLQIGQINLNNSVVGTSRVIGAQLFPETRLQKTKIGGNAVVSGVASESSMVEIYQSGRLIYNTAVPAGPFELSQFTLLNRTNDLQVYLKGVNGSQQDFIVPASTFLRNSLVGDTDYSFGLGRYDDEYANQRPLVASFSKGWGISSYLGLQLGTVVTPDYYNLGFELSAPLSEAISLNINNSIAHDKRHNKTGGLLTSSVSYSLSNNFAVGANALFQSNDYAYLSDSVNDLYDGDKFNNKQKQFGFDVNWSNLGIGSLSSSVGRTYTVDNNYQDYMNFSWNRTFFDNYLFSTTFQRNYTVDNRTEDAFYFRLSIPLERASLASWVNHSDNENRVGVRYNNYVDRDRNWGVAYEHNDNSHYQAVSGNINAVTPYSQIGANIRRSNENQTYWGTSLSGGVVWVKEGLLLSPYEVKDTFGIAKAGDLRFIRVESNSGPTWTNGDGYAVLPSLNPYSSNAIRVDTRTLSRHSDIQNAYKSVNPAKGSIVPTLFSIVNTRRVLVKVKINGELLPVNSVINDSAGNFLTLATKAGEIFLSDSAPDMMVLVETPDKQECIIQLHLPKHAESDVLFEQINEQCTNKDVNRP